MLAIEAGRKSSDKAHEAARVCEKLKKSLTRFAGADGWASLLRRSLTLARADFPSLSHITISPDGSLEGLEMLATQDAKNGAEAGAAIIAQLLGLLVSFIGEPLTLRLVRESWPDASLEE
jgi:hypothetical protein